MKPKEYTGGDATYNVTITLVNPEVWDEFSDLTPTFMELYKPLFRDCVYQAHKYLIRTTPIQTGRLRAGWTSILNKYNIDYVSAFMDVTLLDIPAGSGKALDQSAILEGSAESGFIDADFDVTLVNMVPYAEYVEFGTSKQAPQYYTNRARYKAEFILEDAIAKWFDKIEQDGRIVKANPVEEVVA